MKIMNSCCFSGIPVVVVAIAGFLAFDDYSSQNRYCNASFALNRMYNIYAGKTPMTR